MTEQLNGTHSRRARCAHMQWGDIFEDLSKSRNVRHVGLGLEGGWLGIAIFYVLLTSVL